MKMKHWTPLALVWLACSSNGGETSSDSGESSASDTGDDFPAYALSDALEFEQEQEEQAAAERALDCNVSNDFAGCTGTTYASEGFPLDIYVMFDQSGSMCSCVSGEGNQTCPDASCEQTRLDAVRQAAEDFLSDPDSAGISVGLGFFGKQPIGEASCEISDYDTPAVELGLLPEHAGALMEALSEVTPTGETPTGAALRGACGYAKAHKRDHRERKVVILMLTDGKPEAPLTCGDGSGACCPSLDDAVAAAEECNSGSEAIPSYVLGVGPLLGNLDEIASAGGTEHAYLVEGGDVSEKVLAALNAIRGDASIPCRLQLPEPSESKTFAYDRVNLQYATASCETSGFYAVDGSASCGAEDGWYYDDPSAPSSIELCPATCERVKAPGGQLFYSVGCETQYRIR